MLVNAEQARRVCRVCGKKIDEAEQDNVRAFRLQLEGEVWDDKEIIHTGHPKCIYELHKLVEKLGGDV